MLDMNVNNDDFFPPSPRVLYSEAPLVQVVCQLRFPTLLRVEGQLPIDFQERLRGIYPLFERGQSPFAAQFPGPLPPQIANFFGSQMSGANYQFSTVDKAYTLYLTPDSMTLTASPYAYKRWEDFRGFFFPALDALNEIYQPSFYSRIGLRYINGIERERLGLQTCEWSRLFRPEIIGELAVPNIENRVQVVNKTIQIRGVEDEGTVLLQHGLGFIQGTGNLCYTIDFDFFTDKSTRPEDVAKHLDHFNRRAGRAFRWAITDVLHAALKPVEVAVPE